MLTSTSLLNLIAEEKKHTFISTGMSEFHEIDKTVELFKDKGCPFELMHSTSAYPTKDEDANLKMIPVLRDRYHCNVGYSGHEIGLAVSYGAAAFEITSLERHITLNRAMHGSDQAASIEPIGFLQLCGAVRKINSSLGDGVKRITAEELEVRKKLRGY